MTKRMHLTAESIKALSSCHMDLVRVMSRTARITSLHVLRGAITLEQAQEEGALGAKELHRPSDALEASPDGRMPPQEPDALAELPAAEREALRAHVRDVARWWYLGGVVTGVAETLYDQRAIEEPVHWAGTDSQDDSGITRFERGHQVADPTIADADQRRPDVPRVTPSGEGAGR